MMGLETVMSSPPPSGFHTIPCKGIPFTLPSSLLPHRLLGQGAYGVVCAARSSSSSHSAEIAIKKMPQAIRKGGSLVEGKRALRELLLLRHLQHENVSCLSDAWIVGDDLYLASEAMDSDMHRIISSSQPLSEAHCQWFLYQILRGLKYLHSANVIHRDLKPSNLLVNANCDLKITDFGLARAIEEECGGGGVMTQYVVTRWYRAPEILLFARRYTTLVDIWSTGCIFAELLRRRAIFQGRDQLHQLQLILAQLGTPSAEDLSCVDPRLQNAISTLPPSTGRPLRSSFPEASEEAVDLLDGMLLLNPERRLTAEQGLAHPFLSSLHDAESEPSHDEPFATPEIDDEELDWPTIRYIASKEAELWNVRNGRSSSLAADSENSVESQVTCADGAPPPFYKRSSSLASCEDTDSGKRVRG